MRVTLDVFSGRPNPSWKLNRKQARELLDRTAGRALPTAEAVHPWLHRFRGFVVSEVPKATTRAIGGLASFRLAPESAARTLPEQEAPSLDRGARLDTSRWLLGTAPKEVEVDVLQYVESELRNRELEPAGPRAVPEPTEPGLAFLPAEEEMARGLCQLPELKYAAWLWNTDSYVRANNNCYNYAMAMRTDNYAQPGLASGRVFSSCICDDVKAAALRDGCSDACSGSNKIVALVMDPDPPVDYHWYLLHSDGFWGHKLGFNCATNLDDAGRVIGGALNPQNCSRGRYTVFCGYLFSPMGINVRGYGVRFPEGLSGSC